MEGYKTYRHDSNPKEKELHDKFIDEMITNKLANADILDFIVFGQADKSISQANGCLSDREKRIVISTIQWLGSSVGQSFLRECGFKSI